MITAEAAYRRCEEITWSQARNFAYGIRLLPPPKRRAMAALYAMARRIDDIGDGDWPHDRKLAALDDLHADIDALEAGGVRDPEDPVLAGLAHAAAGYPIPVAALHEIVQGCEQDVRGVTYSTMEDTVRYCRLVAGSVGRLSLGVFGTKAPPPGTRSQAAQEPPHTARTAQTAAIGGIGSGSGAQEPPHTARTAQELADDLGVALQLTNMLRDIAEDHRMGRIYLPEQERERLGIVAGRWEPAESVAELVEHIGAHALDWFGRGLPLLDRLDRRSRACTAAMAGIYRRLLDRILANPAKPLTERMSLPAREKALVALRSLTGLRP